MCAEELTAPFHNREDDHDGEDDGETSDASGSDVKPAIKKLVCCSITYC